MNSSLRPLIRPRTTVATVYEYLRCLDEDPIELTRQQLKDRLSLEIGVEGVGACEKLLEQCGALERLEPRQNMAALLVDSELPTLVDLLPRQASVQRRVLQAVERIVGDRRCERVYLQLAPLAESLEMEALAVSRALRELSRLEAFDYVPPFRGRAVHVLRRERRFDALEIDFERLEALKQAEYEKLKEMTQFARTRQCRQLHVLHYFGEKTGKPCQSCDNCDPQAGQRAADELTVLNGLDDPLYEIVVIALSGFARIEQKFSRRDISFGKQTVAQMLCGSNSAKITKWRLEELSTFGLLSDFKQTHVTALIDALIDVGLVEQTEIERFRPVIRLTDWGGQVMRGQDVLTQPLRIPREIAEQVRRRWRVRPRSPAGSPHGAMPNASDPQLGNIAPPAATSVPPTRDVAHPSPTDPTHNGPPQPEHFWTWRLLDAGFSPQECCSIRGLTIERVIDHVTRSLDDGRVIRIDGFFAAGANLTSGPDPMGGIPRTHSIGSIEPAI